MNALAALILVGGILASGPVTAQTPMPSVTVDGHGEVSAVPDRAVLTMAAVASAPEPADAQNQVNAVIRNFLARARALGAAARQIKTTSASLQAQYDYRGGSQRLLGYRATRVIDLRVDDLSRLGDFLAAAGKAGINHIQPPALKSSQAARLHRQALADAARDARANAQTLADALGVTLGPARVIRGQARRQPPRPMMAMTARAGATDGNQAMGISLGLIEFEADVTVQFDLRARRP